MGEYAEEAIQNGLCEDYTGRKEQPFGSQYNNEVWQDVTVNVEEYVIWTLCIFVL